MIYLAFQAGKQAQFPGGNGTNRLLKTVCLFMFKDTKGNFRETEQVTSTLLFWLFSSGVKSDIKSYFVEI